MPAISSQQNMGSIFNRISTISSLEYLRNKDISSVLEALIELVKEMVKAEAGGIMLYDESSRELVLQKPAFGVDEELIKLYRVPVAGGGNAATVFQSGKPYVSNHAQDDPNILHRFVEIYHIRNIITVPLQVNEKRIGILHVLNKPEGFTDVDLNVMQLISTQLATLLQNAYLIKELDKNKRMTDKLIQLQDEMVQLIVHEKDLDSVAKLVSNYFESTVMIEGVKKRLLSTCKFAGRIHPKDYSTFLRDQTMEEARAKAIAAMSAVTMERPELEGRKYHLSPIFWESELLGFLHVIEEQKSLEKVEIASIQRISAALAMELLVKKNDQSFEERAREEWMRSLLDKGVKPTQTFFKQTSRWGLDLDNSVLVVIASDEDHGSVSLKEGFSKKIYPLFEERCDPKFYAFTKENEVVFLFPGPSKEDWRQYEDRLVRELQLFINSCNLLNVSLSVFYSNPCKEIPCYRKEYDKIQRSNELKLRLHQKNWIATYSSLGFYTLLLEINNEEILHDFYAKVLEDIIAYDREHNTDLLQTLRVYIQENGNIKETAQKLFIHVNSVKYRLQRIEQLTGMNPNHFETRLTVLLAMQIMLMFDFEGADILRGALS